MSRACDICEKSSLKGRKIKMAWGVKYSSIKHRKPNLRKSTLLIKGVKKQVRICAKCLKSVKNDKIKGHKTIYSNK